MPSDAPNADSSTAVEDLPLSESAPEKQATEGEPTPAADSDPAKPKPRQKTPADTSRRFNELLRKNRELTERLERVEAAAPKPKEPEPLRRPVFADYKQFGEEAWDRYDRDLDAYSEKKLAQTKAEAKREAAEEFEKSSKEREQSKFFADLSSQWNKQLEAERAADPEFDDVAFAEDLAVTDPMLRYMFRQKDVGAKILKWLGHHPDEAERISRLDNDSMVEALAEIKLSIGGKTNGNKAAAPGRKLSNAPPPPNEAGGRNGVPAAGDAMMNALARNDTKEYMRLYREQKIREAGAK